MLHDSLVQNRRLLRYARNDETNSQSQVKGHCEHITPALHFGVVHERNAFLSSILQVIASGDFIALAMTSRKSHCESAVADAAVSVQITHARTKFLRRSGSDVAISSLKVKINNPLTCFFDTSGCVRVVIASTRRGRGNLFKKEIASLRSQ